MYIFFLWLSICMEVSVWRAFKAIRNPFTVGCIGRLFFFESRGLTLRGLDTTRHKLRLLKVAFHSLSGDENSLIYSRSLRLTCPMAC
jgi:hypothetical protein